MLISCLSFSRFRCLSFLSFFLSFSFFVSVCVLPPVPWMRWWWGEIRTVFLAYRLVKRIHRLIDPSLAWRWLSVRLPFFLFLPLWVALAIRRLRVQTSIDWDVSLEDFSSLLLLLRRRRRVFLSPSFLLTDGCDSLVPKRERERDRGKRKKTKNS